MATVTPVKNKDGAITSYRIRVYRGVDPDGKRLKDYSMNWKIPDTYKSERAIQKALEKVVGEFESSCNRGEISTDNRSFGEYARYYIELCERDRKPTTIDFYNNLMTYIEPEIGAIKLKALSPEHLNRFYKKLETEDVKREPKAIAKDKLIQLKKERKVMSKTLYDETGLRKNTIGSVFAPRNVSVETARKISEYFGLPVDQLFTFSTSGKGLSAGYIRHIHTFIHAVLEKAVKEGAINRNAADQSTPPRKPKHEAEFFEIEDILRIKEQLDREPLKYRVATYLLIDTGIRRGELIGIRWSSVNLEKCTIRIENNVVCTRKEGLINQTPKTNDYRTINIAPELIPILKEYRRVQRSEIRLKFQDVEDDLEKARLIKNFNKDGYLFIQESGKPMNPASINMWMAKLSKKLDLHIHPHKFRHSQASILYASGVDIVTISKRLGHKQVSTTQNIYAHVMEQSDKQASDKISELLFKNG